MEKVTREILRGMKIGETRAFVLPDVSAIESARSTVYQAQRVLDCEFTVKTNFANMTLTITKSPKP